MYGQSFFFFSLLFASLLFTSCGERVQIIESIDPNATSAPSNPLVPIDQSPKIALQISSHTPSNDAIDIRLDARITINFNTDIDKDSASIDTLEVYDASNILLEGNIVVANEKLYFYPINHLRLNTTYTVLVSQYITSTQSVRLGEDYTFSFATITSIQRPADAPSIPFE